MPRGRRIKSKEESYYHITTRIVEQTYRFTKAENRRNVDLMRVVEDFSGVQVLSYCFMSNHFHILLRVPKAEAISETELFRRIEVLYGTKECQSIQNRWANFKAGGDTASVREEQNAFLKRMYDMGEFMKTLKQRLTQSYNRRNDRKGTLWEERYHSLLLEGTPKVLAAVSAYIDLNPVRAGMVSDPKDYRFSGYGEACTGEAKAREGLCRVYREGDTTPEWSKVAPLYRMTMVLTATPHKGRKGMTEEAIREVLAADGELPLPEILGHKNRVFSSGIGLGRAPFMQRLRQDLKLDPHPEETAQG